MHIFHKWGNPKTEIQVRNDMVTIGPLAGQVFTSERLVEIRQCLTCEKTHTRPVHAANNDVAFDQGMQAATGS